MMMKPSINISSVMMKNRMSRPARESVSQSRLVLGESRRYFITLNMHRKIDVESTMNIRLYLRGVAYAVSENCAQNCAELRRNCATYSDATGPSSWYSRANM